MSDATLRDSRFFELLLRIDEDLAAQRRADGCPCGGVVHGARYPRKPRGVPEAAELAWRLSFCCSRDGCRRRVTPPSVRFLGRRIYLGAIVVLASAMRSGVTPARASRLKELFGVSRQTLERWRVWWQETFPATPFWTQARARLAVPVAPSELPQGLLARFAGDVEARLVALLRFLAPITTGSIGARSLMGL